MTTKTGRNDYLMASIEILDNPGNVWHVGVFGSGKNEDELITNTENQIAYYQSAEYRQYAPLAQVHIETVSQLCATCNGTGKVTKKFYHVKICPTCRGKNSEVILYRDRIPLHFTRS